MSACLACGSTPGRQKLGERLHSIITLAKITTCLTAEYWSSRYRIPNFFKVLYTQANAKKFQFDIKNQPSMFMNSTYNFQLIRGYKWGNTFLLCSSKTPRK